MEHTVYVIGHRNPDTDSVVAASAYAELKRAQGMSECRAARAGAVNPQTEYVFDRFGVPLPEFVPDLIPRVDSWLTGPVSTVRDTTPLWEALALMDRAEHKALPIVDDAGRYHSLLHYGAFAENIVAKINPNRKAVIPTSIGHLRSTVKAQPLAAFDEDAVFKARIVVAAQRHESVEAALRAEAPANVILVVGDREDVQRTAIEAGVRVVIVTNGNLVSRELRELATRRRVSLLVSPYDTSGTVLLALYSTPVGTMADGAIKPIARSSWLVAARGELAKSPSRAVPVVDDEGRVVGLFTESDLLRESAIEIILVDHNEFTQAVEGIEHYRILEVIDHHRLGTFTTKHPITFINRVVGSTSTIIAGLYRDLRVPLTRATASLLLCGLLSDTLVLRSATTTDADREEADYLANVADLEIESLGRDLLGSASTVARRPVAEILRLDLKEYTAGGKRLAVSQVEVMSTDELLQRRAEILQGLAAMRGEKGLYLAGLMATDITNLSSILFIDAEREFLGLVGYPRAGPGVYLLNDILSRKKQLMPAVFELVERATAR